MRKKNLKHKKTTKKTKFKSTALILGISLILSTIISCEPEENECETKTVCYEGGRCIETTVGKCF